MQNEQFKDKEVLLKVEHLCQYFKMGPATELKAVDDVSFELHKGEVFGLVGESGCGKTTTGRSIIRLYDITSGNIYFEGHRICAGTRSYKDAVRKAREEYKKQVGEIKNEIKEITKNGATSVPAELTNRLNEAEEKFHAIVREQTANMRAAIDDHKHCDAKYAKAQVEKVKSVYAPVLKSVEEAFEAYEASSKGEKQADELLNKVKNAAEEIKNKKDLLGSSSSIDHIGSVEEVEDRHDYALKLDKAIKKQMKEDIRLAKKDRIMNKMQMIFQDPIASLDPRMTVRDIIAEGLIIRGVKNKKYIDEMVYKMLDLVGLVPEHAGRYPHEFSGGQRQRIGIARAIILNPDFIIADEPISALDVSIQAQVINLLNDLRHKLGLTILFIAHDLSVVKYFSDTIAVMYYGKIVEMASSDELFAHPLHPYTKSLLSAIPLPDPEFEKQRQRITYNPIVAHDYTVEKPTMREIVPGHLISCNQAEFERYQEEIAQEK